MEDVFAGSEKAVIRMVEPNLKSYCPYYLKYYKFINMFSCGCIINKNFKKKSEDFSYSFRM